MLNKMSQAEKDNAWHKRRCTKMTETPDIFGFTIPRPASDHYITPECVTPFFLFSSVQQLIQNMDIAGGLICRKEVCLTEENLGITTKRSGQLKCAGSR